MSTTPSSQVVQAAVPPMIMFFATWASRKAVVSALAVLSSGFALLKSRLQIGGSRLMFVVCVRLFPLLFLAHFLRSSFLPLLLSNQKEKKSNQTKAHQTKTRKTTNMTQSPNNATQPKEMQPNGEHRGITRSPLLQASDLGAFCSWSWAASAIKASAGR